MRVKQAEKSSVRNTLWYRRCFPCKSLSTHTHLSTFAALTWRTLLLRSQFPITGWLSKWRTSFLRQASLSLPDCEVSVPEHRWLVALSEKWPPEHRWLVALSEKWPCIELFLIIRCCIITNQSLLPVWCYDQLALSTCTPKKKNPLYTLSLEQ